MLGILVGGDEARLHARSPALMASADVEVRCEAVSQHRRRFPRPSRSARRLGSFARGGISRCRGLPRMRILRRGRRSVLPLVRDRVVRRSGHACATAAVSRLLRSPRAARAADPTACAHPFDRPRRARPARRRASRARRMSGVRERAPGARARGRHAADRPSFARPARALHQARRRGLRTAPGCNDRQRRSRPRAAAG